MFSKLRDMFAFDPTTYEPPDGIPTPTTDHVLELYKFDSCPFCMRVMRVLDRTGIKVELRDTRASAEAEKELFEMTGKTQVPCLVIDGTPLLESKEISRWLDAYAIRNHA